jgi:hypothetical protein
MVHMAIDGKSIFKLHTFLFKIQEEPLSPSKPNVLPFEYEGTDERLAGSDR